MEFANVAGAHTNARILKRPNFFFSRWIFDRIKENGNTHYCLHCGGWYGFKPGPDGQALNAKGHMSDHDPVAHADGIIGNADKYGRAADWLEKEIARMTRRSFIDWVRRKPKTFPFVVTLQ